MAEEHQYCTFFLDGLYFGIDVLKVQEVIRYQEMTRVSLAPPVVRGLINLRGQIVTAIDLRRRVRHAGSRCGPSPVNVVVHTDDGAVSLLVDEIGDVLEVPEKMFERPPETLKGTARELIRGAYKLEQRLLLILDTERTVNLANGLRLWERPMTPTSERNTGGTTLFERIGGIDAITAAVDSFYERVFADPVLAPFFVKTNKSRLRKRQVQFFCRHSEAPRVYKGRDMKTAHENMVIAPSHFDSVAGHLTNATGTRRCACSPTKLLRSLRH